MAVRQYIGARYVPKFYEGSNGSEWDANVQYEPLTIVTYLNNTYTSKRFVPASVGSPMSSPDYWVATGMYNEQLNAVVERVNTLEITVGDTDSGLVKDVDTLETIVGDADSGLVKDVDTLETVVGDANSGLVKEVNDIKTEIANDKRKYLLISDSYACYVSDNITYSWSDGVILKTGIDGYNLSTGDIGFAPPHGAIGSFYTLLQDAIQNELLGDLSSYTDVVVGGGANDIVNLALGNVTKADLIANIGTFVGYVKSNFPNAHVSVGMIGQVKSANYAKNWADCIEAYRACIRYGASYLTNVEYILRQEHMKEDGIHPTPDGFNELIYYMSQAVIDRFCCVDRAGIELPSAAVLTANIGTWNAIPPMLLSQHNGTYRLCTKSQLYGITFDENNRLSIDTVVSSMAYGGYKYFAIGRPIYGDLKGSEYSANHQIYIVDTIDVNIFTTASHNLNVKGTLVLIQGILYIGLPDNSTVLAMVANDPTLTSEGFLYMYPQPFDVEIDVSNYNGW